MKAKRDGVYSLIWFFDVLSAVLSCSCLRCLASVCVHKHSMHELSALADDSTSGRCRMNLLALYVLK